MPDSSTGQINIQSIALRDRGPALKVDSDEIGLQNIGGVFMKVNPDGTNTPIGGTVAPAIPPGAAITFAGDSITSGFLDSGPGTASAYRWSAQLEKRLTRTFTQHGKTPPTYTNTAVSGQTSAQMLAIPTQYIVNGQTDIFIMIGVNDVAAAIAPSVTAANLTTMINAIIAAQPTTRIHVVSTCFCLGESTTSTNNINLAATNAAEASVCNLYSPTQVEWIDVQSESFAFEESYNINGYTNGLLTQSQGTHMSQMGSFLISDIVYEALTLTLPPSGFPNTIRRYGPPNLSPWAMRRWNMALQCSANLTDWYEVHLGKDVPVAAATGLTVDGAIDGGGVGGTGATNAFVTSRRIINTNPRTFDWAFSMHIFYAAIAGGQGVYFGLKDTTTNTIPVGASTVPGIFFALEPTTNANHLLRLNNGSNHDTVGNVVVGSGGITMDIDIIHAGSTIYLFFNGFLSTSVSDANSPTVPLAPYVASSTPANAMQRMFFAYPKF